MDDDIPYLLLTPGPLTTSRTVRQAMQRDLSTWDVDYNSVVQSIREQLVALAVPEGSAEHTAVLIQGSGTFAVEATLGSAVAADGRLLVLSNGAYGVRMAEIAHRLRIPPVEIRQGETEAVDLDRVRDTLSRDESITHVAMVHCETTTGMLNPAREIGQIADEFGSCFILDAMSSFGGMPIDIEDIGVEYLISSANKCLQGVPGFGFVIARRETLEVSAGRARSLSLDLHDQWRQMEEQGGKWRYTSPTHSVIAFAQALAELRDEGGVDARSSRYRSNHETLVEGMTALGFRTLLPAALQSPFITSFHNPADSGFSFPEFYDRLKARRFVIYPGKVTDAETFRIGTIGHVFPEDIRQLLVAIGSVQRDMGFEVS